VLDSGSFVRAANELGLTQPAISKAIFDLESFFEEEVFTRSNRGVLPTDFGVMLGRRVQSLLAELRYMTDEVHAYRTGEAGHVIVGTLISASAQLLPKAIGKLQSEAAGVLVTIKEGTAPQLFPALATGELDIVVGRLPEADAMLPSAFPIRHEVLFEEAFCVVAGTEHPMAGKTDVQISELASFPWIFPLAESPARLAAQRMFRDAGLLVPAPRVESLSILANIALLHESSMLAFMPKAAALHLSKVGSLVILDAPATHSTAKVGFSVRADKEVAPSCKRFIGCLRASALEISDLLA
jgi:DNA-binding transcriptional LysR family regulator